MDTFPIAAIVVTSDTQNVSSYSEKLAIERRERRLKENHELKATDDSIKCAGDSKYGEQ
jgi:hypothetical protein